MKKKKIPMRKCILSNEMHPKKDMIRVVANDASDNTAKLITDKCKSYKVPFRKFGNRNELGIALGKGERVNVGITDPGFAKKLLSMIDEYHKEWLYE